MKFIIACFLLMGLAACSNDEINAAGAIAYAEQDGKHFVLLADHAGLASFRGYAAFGGGLEVGETLEEGALREFHEETACHFLGKIQSISKTYVRNQNYVSFVVRIPFIPSEQLNNALVSSQCEGGVFSERTDWVWVEQGALIKQLQTGDEYQDETMDLSLWDKSTVVIKLASEQGLLP